MWVHCGLTEMRIAAELVLEASPDAGEWRKARVVAALFCSPGTRLSPRSGQGAGQ